MKFEEIIKEDKIKNYFIHSSILVNTDGASLNNWGKDLTNSQGVENTTAVKKVLKNGRMFAIVSGQAWRFWWREALGLNGWNLSPITRDKKFAFTEANPLKYPDDDVFGYMKATKIEKKDVTVTRVSPLKNSILSSVAPIDSRSLNEFSVMARQSGEAPVPYEKQSYSTVLKGLFSLDLDQLGTFTKNNRAGYKNVNEKDYEAIAKEGSEIDDLINPNIKRARLDKKIRQQRAKDTILALKTISGGAKLTTNYVSVKPDFIVLVISKGGNNIFDNIAVETNGRATLSLDALREVIRDNKQYLRSDIFIAKAIGFMDDVILKFEDNKIEGVKVHIGSVNETIDKFVQTIETVLF